ncbi:AbrB family transcriptional regulator [Streptomyces sp. NPDC002790]|uniref:AbrB family transcriptional regulator n=1 Tax=Streptomyces sp. NPDC002790 TaxID=3154431 RepID=UPI00332F2A7B
MSQPRFWALLVSSYAVAAAVLTLLRVPSAALLAGVIAGAATTLMTGGERRLPGGMQGYGLAVVGVAAGSQIDDDVVRLVLDAPVQIIGSVLVTLAVTMACGQLLRLAPGISATTAAFASIAGAASGVTGVVREVGGDDAAVMAIQYLRVIAVLVSVPLAAHVLGGAAGRRLRRVRSRRRPASATGPGPPSPPPAWWPG